MTDLQGGFVPESGQNFQPRTAGRPTFLMLKNTLRPQPVGTKALAQKRRLISRGIAILLGIVGLALIYVWTRVQTVQLGYEVTRLEKQLTALSYQKSQLETEVTRLKSPARLEKIAREQFGMRLPNGSEIVFIKSE